MVTGQTTSIPSPQQNLRPSNTEPATGHSAKIRAALIGAGLGGWLGLLTGVVLALFVAGHAWLAVSSGGLLVGAFLGALVGSITHWAADGRRDDRPSRPAKPAMSRDNPR